jgi:RHS repeat-associated protein
MRSARTGLLLLVGVLFASGSWGYNIPPFATDHEYFLANGGDPNNSPGPDTPCSSGSPVDVATGNFFQTIPILAIPSYGPPINIALNYHSFDKRKGPFGFRWSFSYDQRALRLTDGVSLMAVCAGATGRRNTYTRAADGSYTALPFVQNSLSEKPDGSLSLRDKHGTVRNFDATGKLMSIVDRNGNTLNLVYDSGGFLTTVTDASGRSVTFTKGADGRTASLTDPANRQFKFSYDNSGNLTSVSDPMGNATSLQYDANDHLTSLADPKGNVLIKASYDANSSVSSYTNRGETWVLSYNSAAKRTTETDSSGNQWIYTYNSSGSITKTTDPLSNMVTRVYDANLNVISITDGNSNTTNSSFDARGNPLTIKDAIGNGITATYDSVFSFPLTIKDRLGNVTQYLYDPSGNLTKAIDPLGNTTTYQHDAKGQLATITDALGSTSSMTRDSYGNVLTRTNPLSQTQAATYDILSNRTSVTDANGKITQSAFDSNLRLTKSINPIGGTTSFAYDASGNLSTITMPNGGAITYQYDVLSRVQRVTNPIGKFVSYSYDKKDNLTSKTDANGVTSTYTFDAIGRMISRNGGSDPLTYTYDNNGNIVTIRNNSTTLTYSYDALNHVSQARTSGSTFQPASQISYAYDASGRRKTMTDPSGGVTNYGYDATSRLTSIQDPASQTFGFGYDNLNRRTSLTGPLGHFVSYSWNVGGRLTGSNDQSPAGSLLFSYTQDAVGNILSKIDAAGSHSYGYDAANRLISANHPSSEPAEMYSYDGMGNRMSSLVSSAYSYDLANRLLGDTTFDYSYDGNGNLTRKTERANGKITTYNYDSENRLTSVVVPSGSVYSYRYDGIDRRIAKLANNIVTVQYVYDGLDILSEYTGSGALAASYTQGPGVDEVLSVRRGTTSSDFQKDHLGSVIRTFSGTTASNSIRTDSFGRLLSQAGTPQSPYSFTGREFDSETGLYYYRTRYYDPEIGRFTSPDPIGILGGGNLYSYVSANPVNATDPSGEFGLVGAGVGAGIGGIGNLLYQLYNNGGHLGCVNWGEVAAFAAGGAAIGSGAELLAALFAEEGSVLEGTALARQLGIEGEEAVGLTGEKTAIEVAGRTRIPDALTDTTLTEVKNVARQSFTQQLRDFSAYAQETGRTFELYVRPSTQLSGPLQEAVSNGKIILRFIPGAQ